MKTEEFSEESQLADWDFRDVFNAPSVNDVVHDVVSVLLG